MNEHPSFDKTVFVTFDLVDDSVDAVHLNAHVVEPLGFEDHDSWIIRFERGVVRLPNKFLHRTVTFVLNDENPKFRLEMEGPLGLGLFRQTAAAPVAVCAVDLVGRSIKNDAVGLIDEAEIAILYLPTQRRLLATLLGAKDLVQLVGTKISNVFNRVRRQRGLDAIWPAQMPFENRSGLRFDGLPDFTDDAFLGPQHGRRYTCVFFCIRQKELKSV